MADVLKIDREFIEKKRKELKLPTPVDFEQDRITPDLIEKLMELIRLPFDSKAIEVGKGKKGGFKSKGVPYLLQLDRVQQVMGTSHVKIEHELVEVETVLSNEPDKAPMHYCKVYVTLKIGNYTFYVDSTNKPDASFVPYYVVSGIGYDGNTKKGTAEKSALANGLKDCFTKMGMLRELYLEEDDDGSNGKKGSDKEEVSKTIQLISDPNFFQTGIFVFKVLCKDVDDGKEVEALMYRESRQNPDEHKEMVEKFLQGKDRFAKGITVKVLCKEQEYQGKAQYIVSRFIKDKE